MTLPLFLAALPSTNNYKLNSYGIGSGGSANSSTSNYAVEGISGEIGGPDSTTSNYNLKPGYIQTQQANVPKISAFDNGSGRYYNSLHFVIDTQGNPSDALYALQISTSSTFSSNVNYVKVDLTIGSTLTTADYQTYTAWGGASGSNITTLSPNTTYYLRAKATQGKFTESAYGPSASATTVNPSLSFSVSPTSLAMNSLLPNTIVSGQSTISLNFDTNATGGGSIYIAGQYGGLKSSVTPGFITSASGLLSSVSHGFGAQVTSASSPLAAVSPYTASGGADDVGIADSTIRQMITSPSPVTSGTGTITLKAKSAPSDPAANDYKEFLTVLASASF